MRVCIIVVIMTALSTSTHADTLYLAPTGVDAGDCRNPASPCYSINYANLQIYFSGGANNHQYIIMQPGTYNYTGTQNAGSGNPLQIVGAGRELTIINFSSLTANCLDASGNLMVSNLTIKSTVYTTNNRHAIYIGVNRYLHVDSVDFVDFVRAIRISKTFDNTAPWFSSITNSRFSCTKGGYAIQLRTARLDPKHLLIKNCDFTDFVLDSTFQNNTVIWALHLTTNIPSTVPRVTIEDCLFHTSGRAAIVFEGNPMDMKPIAKTVVKNCYINGRWQNASITPPLDYASAILIQNYSSLDSMEIINTTLGVIGDVGTDTASAIHVRNCFGGICKLTNVEFHIDSSNTRTFFVVNKDPDGSGPDTSAVVRAEFVTLVEDGVVLSTQQQAFQRTIYNPISAKVIYDPIISDPLNMSILHFDVKAESHHHLVSLILHSTENGSFELMRSVDGKQWYSIAYHQVPIHSAYEYQQRFDADRSAYYRIKMISQSGRVQYSNIVYVSHDHQSPPRHVWTTGNVVSWEIADAEYVYQIELVDIRGKTIWRQDISQQPFGQATLPLAPGMYIIRMKDTIKKVMISP
jgi:hypothetical protein